MQVTTSDSVITRLLNIDNERRPVYKIILSSLEGWIGHYFYRKSPPILNSPVNLLHLGCGDHHFPEWVNADFYRFSDLIRKSRGLPDWMLDVTKLWKCPDNFWDGIHTEHMIEHLDYRGVINTFREALRTLKPGCWIRVVVPGVDETLASSNFMSKAEAIAALTQTHGHISAWDKTLLSGVLQDVGFSEVHHTSYNVGHDQRIVRDLAERAVGSLYVEAKK